jgi:hypothetical protein
VARFGAITQVADGLSIRGAIWRDLARFAKVDHDVVICRDSSQYLVKLARYSMKLARYSLEYGAINR